jgi:predicted aspartyl protease
MIIISLLALIIISAVVYYFLRKEAVKSTALSFKSAMELTNLPVVTFYSGKKKLNMLLDTGSSENIISKEHLASIYYTPTGRKTEIFGKDGIVTTDEVVNTTISYSGLKFDIEVLSTDMKDAFELIKKESGVTIHGILGSGFFTRYKYVLDFDKLMFYKK